MHTRGIDGEVKKQDPQKKIFKKLANKNAIRPKNRGPFPLQSPNLIDPPSGKKVYKRGIPSEGR